VYQNVVVSPQCPAVSFRCRLPFLTENADVQSGNSYWLPIATPARNGGVFLNTRADLHGVVPRVVEDSRHVDARRGERGRVGPHALLQVLEL
jgi:hypothetical protein